MESSDFTKESLQYMAGFGNHHCTEALPDALPKNQNNPQKCSYGLYAEQLSGTPFTYARSKNQFSWTYRILPSANQHPEPMSATSKLGGYFVSDFTDKSKGLKIDPRQRRWTPLKDHKLAPHTPTNFVQGIKTMCGAGDPAMKDGLGIHLYGFNQNMFNTAFYSADGDLLIVP